ncbi:MAG: toxic anion resistance protein, partial [Chloroflexi bacterium]|nr:toxic anion resistance protein [Chloroflexota bacterium]
MSQEPMTLDASRQNLSVALELAPLNALPAEQQEQVRALMAKLDPADTQSVLTFGIEAQKQVTTAADQMIQKVRNKDVGPVGDVLNEMMLHVRGLGIDDLQVGKDGRIKRGFLRRLNPIAKFIQRYETIESQINDLVSVLNAHRLRLMRDVSSLDSLYEATLQYFHQLKLYIIAGQEKLRELDEKVIPALRRKAEESGDMLDAQALRDVVARRDDLERRVHDLMLTRQVTLQSLPQIRLIQDVDKSLVNKIQSSILTTIPVWKSQIAMAITLWNQQKALETQKKVTDTTNEMLERNAELLRMGSAEARKEIERGIFDIEAIKKVN